MLLSAAGQLQVNTRLAEASGPTHGFVLCSSGRASVQTMHQKPAVTMGCRMGMMDGVEHLLACWWLFGGGFGDGLSPAGGQVSDEQVKTQLADPG